MERLALRATLWRSSMAILGRKTHRNLLIIQIWVQCTDSGIGWLVDWCIRPESGVWIRREWEDLTGIASGLKIKLRNSIDQKSYAPILGSCCLLLESFDDNALNVLVPPTSPPLSLYVSACRCSGAMLFGVDLEVVRVVVVSNRGRKTTDNENFKRDDEERN